MHRNEKGKYYFVDPIFSNKVPILYEEGLDGLKEAISFLKVQKPVGSLTRNHVLDESSNITILYQQSSDFKG